MNLGLSTYSFFWHGSDRAVDPWNLDRMIERTAELGATVFQICDHPAIETMHDSALRALADRAELLGVSLEVGMRGLRAEQLRRHLRVARILDADLVRSMWVSGSDRPTPLDAERELRSVLGEYSDAGVTLALETYEQVPTQTLAAVVEQIGDAHLGICLDPANTIAGLETPRAVIDRVADLTVNLHVKDFVFRRQPGLVGFELTGAELGTGLLEADELFDRLRPDSSEISCVVEHWLPWQQDGASTIAATIAAEDAWTRAALEWMRGWTPSTRPAASSGPAPMPFNRPPESGAIAHRH